MIGGEHEQRVGPRGPRRALDDPVERDQAVQTATKEWRELLDTGRFTLINVRDCWMKGVSNPELETLPPDILEKWGVVQMVEGGGNPVVREPERPPVVRTTANVAGRWAYTITAPNGAQNQGQLQIAAQGNQLTIVAAAAYQLQGPDGQIHQFTEQNNFVGAINGVNILAECRQATLTMDGRPMPPQGLPLRMALTVSQDGSSMRGQVANSMGATANIAAQR